MTGNPVTPSLSDLIQRVRELDKALPTKELTAVEVTHRGEGGTGYWYVTPLSDEADGPWLDEEEARLIAEYRTLAPQLADAAERMQGENERLEQQMAVLIRNGARAIDQENATYERCVIAEKRVAELEGQMRTKRDEIAAYYEVWMAGRPQNETAMMVLGHVMKILDRSVSPGQIEEAQDRTRRHRHEPGWTAMVVWTPTRRPCS